MKDIINRDNKSVVVVSTTTIIMDDTNEKNNKKKKQQKKDKKDNKKDNKKDKKEDDKDIKRNINDHDDHDEKLSDTATTTITKIKQIIDTTTTNDNDSSNNNNHINNNADVDEQEEMLTTTETTITKKKRIRKRKRSKQQQDINEEEDNGEEGDNKKKVMKEQQVDDNDIDDEINRTLYMEGIPYTASYDDVRQFFTSTEKEVKGNEVKDSQQKDNNNDNDNTNNTTTTNTHIKDIRLPVWNDTGRLRGYGHIVFDTIEYTQYILKTYNKKSFLNHQRYITLQYANQKDNNNNGDRKNKYNDNDNKDPSDTIILTNLSYDVTEEDIEQYMLNNYNKIKIKNGGIRVIRDYRTSRSKGFAYIQFDNVENAIYIMKQYEQQPIIIKNRKCYLDYDHGRIKGSYRLPNRQFWSNVYNDK